MFLCIASILAISMIQSNNQIQNNLGSSEGIGYKGVVCTYVTRADGTVEDNGCNHNVLFDTGAELIEDYLADGSGGGDAVDWIELCDATNATCAEPTADSSEEYTAWVDSGLAKSVGTVGDNGNGNWSVWKTFTSTADGAIVNVTHLINDDDDEFAGNSFTDVTLQANDQLTINWTVSVS